jgi:Uma2 family endonuclease
MAGAPLVVIELLSPGDESYEKLPFYAALGVPEVWIFDRDTKAVELRTLTGSAYTLRVPDPDGWLRSPATGVQFRPVPPNKVRLRIGDNDATAADLPEG